MERKWKQLHCKRVYLGHIGIMDEKMEATIL